MKTLLLLVLTVCLMACGDATSFEDLPVNNVKQAARLYCPSPDTYIGTVAFGHPGDFGSWWTDNGRWHEGRYVVSVEDLMTMNPSYLPDYMKWDLICTQPGTIPKHKICNHYYANWCVAADTVNKDIISSTIPKDVILDITGGPWPYDVKFEFSSPPSPTNHKYIYANYICYGDPGWCVMDRHTAAATHKMYFVVSY